MGIRQILHEGDPTLLKRSREITNFDERLHTLLDDMKDTMLQAEGMGLAAPQVGVLRRAVIVMDLNKEDCTLEEQIIELVNPEIVKTEDMQAGTEGCLSMPGLMGVAIRPTKVTVKAFDRYGKEFEVYGTGLTARAFCHETDHLNGILFTSIATRVFNMEDEKQVDAFNKYLEVIERQKD